MVRYCWLGLFAIPKCEDNAGFYRGFKFAEYGPTYERITAIHRGYGKNGEEQILVELRGADDDLPE